MNANSTQSASQTENTPSSQLITKPVQSPLNQVVPIPDEDLSAIRGIFGIDTFFATETIPYQEGAIFKGNLAEPETVFERLTGSLQERLGIATAYFSGKSGRKACFIVLPSRNDPQSTMPQKILAVLL